MKLLFLVYGLVPLLTFTPQAYPEGHIGEKNLFSSKKGLNWISNIILIAFEINYACLTHQIILFSKLFTEVYFTELLCQQIQKFVTIAESLLSFWFENVFNLTRYWELAALFSSSAQNLWQVFRPSDLHWIYSIFSLISSRERSSHMVSAPPPWSF